MAKRTINVEYKALNTQFNEALADMRGEVKTLNKEFALQKEQMKDTADESSKLLAKLENLKGQYDVQNRAVEKTQEAWENSARLLGENSVEAQNWYNKLLDSQTALQRLGNEIKNTNGEYEKSIANMTGYGKKLEMLQAESKNLETELKDIDAALKMDPGNVDLVEQKYKNLREQIEKSTESIQEMEKKQAGLKDVDTKGYEKLTREIVTSKGKLDLLNQEVKTLDDSKAPKNLKEDIQDISEEAKKTSGSIGDWGDGFKALLGAGAIGGVIAGVSTVKDLFGKLISDSLELSRNKAIIKYSMNIDNESVAAVQGAIREVETYGVDSQEALEGVRKQFLLNKDASDESNESIVKMAGYLAAAWSGLDFNEIIQESNEIATQFEIGQEEALGMVDALLKVGFPPDQLDIISEYGNQLKMAGYEAEDIQAIFKAGIDTGSWNIDNLLDGVKEGRIKLTEFAREIPEATKPAIKAIGMTEDEFQSLAKEVAKGGDSGKKAYEKIAAAVLDVDDKTEQANAGTTIWGTLWEEQGTKVAETIVNASDSAVTMTGNVDGLNRSIAGMDAEPAKRYAETMQKLDENLIPLKLSLAQMANDTLTVVNAALEGTSVKGKELDQVITDLVASGTKNAQQYGYVWAEYEDGRVMVSDATGTHFRNLSKEEQALWAENAAALKTNAQSINDLIAEKMESYKETTELGMTGAEVATVKAMSAMETAVRSYATNSGTELEKARGSVTKLAEKYGFSEEQVVTVLENWGGSVEDFDKAHGEALGRAEKAVTDYTTVATDGFSKLTQNETISWTEYLKNMEANRKAQANWWKNLKILNNAGIDDAIIAEWEAMGPAAGAQMQRFVDDLYKNSDKQGVAYDDMDKKTKAKVDKMNETRRQGFESGAQIADEAINEADWPGKGERMIAETAEGMVNTIPALNTAAEKVGKSGGNSIASGLSASEVKTNVKQAAARTGQYIEDEIGNSLDAVKRDAKNLDWTFSRPKIPKFTMNGDFNTRTGEVPRIQYSWYAKGGYAPSTTLIGMGEAGAEGIVPLQGKHMMPFADAVAERISNTTNATNIIINASVNSDADMERLGRTIDRHLNTQSHEVKIVKGR